MYIHIHITDGVEKEQNISPISLSVKRDQKSKLMKDKINPYIQAITNNN